MRREFWLSFPMFPEGLKKSDDMQAAYEIAVETPIVKLNNIQEDE